MGKIEAINFWDMPKDHPLYSEIRERLIIRGKSPEEDSEFDRNTLKYRNLSNNEFLNALKKDKYNVLVIYDESNFHGYVAHQRKEDEMHIFESSANENLKGNFLTRKIIQQALDHIKNKGFRKVIFDRDSKELVDFLKRRESNFRIAVNPQTNSFRFIPIGLETGLF